MKAPLTTEMPGLVLSTWKAARKTWLGHHTVGMAGLNHQAAQIKRIGSLLASLLYGDALLLAELGEKLCIGFNYFCIVGVKPRSLLDVGEAHLVGKRDCIFLAADKQYLCGAYADNIISCAQGARLGVFRKHQTLGMLLGFRCKSFKQCHGIQGFYLFKISVERFSFPLCKITNLFAHPQVIAFPFQASSRIADLRSADRCSVATSQAHLAAQAYRAV